MRHLAAITAVIIMIGSTFFLRTAGMRRYLMIQHYDSTFAIPSATTLTILSIRHREALADLLWIRGLIYVGEDLRHHGQIEHVLAYGERITGLDPHFRRAYSWTATLGLYRPNVSLDEALAAVHVLERAAELFPDDAELSWELASAYTYELPSMTTDIERKRQLRSIGADHMVVAARLGAGPPWLALSNAGHLENLGRLDQAVRHLEEMFAVVDDATRAEIALRLETLQAEGRAQMLRAADAELRQMASDDYPWLPLDFYAVVGHRRLTQMDD
ncbi:MAG: hypothetical protein KF901_26830 [Myxococcales bacterium]|nr:hypothetical protein [Myxococcales bacterium]